MFKRLPILFCLLLTLLIFKPLLNNLWFPVHDATHLDRIRLIGETVINGQFPPIWAANINNGYGYPLFHFYAPLFHFSAAILNALTGGSSVLALKLMLVITSLIGSLGFYKLGSRWGRAAGILATCAFILSPYGAVNLYVRGAFSEYLALSFLPWVFLTLTTLKSKHDVVLGAIAISLFGLSHNLVPLISAPAILIWGYFNNRRNLKNLALSFLFGVLISSWFVLPLLFERGFTQADQIARTTEYSLHYVEPWQIWNSTWGFGGSAKGVEDGMSFKLGKIQILFGIVGLLWGIYRKNKQIIMLGGFAALSFFLTTSYSAFVWDHLSLLQIVQFPWRNLGLLAVFLALLSGYSLTLFKNKIIRVSISFILVVSLLVLNLKYFVPQSLTRPSTNTSGIVNIIPEYMPVWMSRTPRESATNVPQELVGPASLEIPRAYYPTWVGKLDGRKIPLYPTGTGLIMVEVPEGSHKFTLSQSHTNLERFSYLLTLVSIGALFLYSKKKIK